MPEREVFKMKTRVTPFIFLLLLILSGCRRPEGYGVVVWASEEDSPPNGAFVKVLERSNLRGTFLLRPSDAKRNYELKAWQVEFFKDRDDAVAFSRDFEALVDKWAVCGKSGLPVREMADAGSRRVYKLSSGESVKILGQGAEKVKVGHLEGYWYRILTKDGTRGWCFDHYLDVFAMVDGKQVFAQGDKKQKSGEDVLFGVTWRPELYQTRVNQGQVDTALFQSDYKLVFDDVNRKIIMQAPRRRWERSYESVVEGKPGQFTFVGAHFMATVNHSSFITIQFSQDGKEIAEPWIVMEKEPAQIVSEELKRRDGVYRSLVEFGPVLKSDRYGTLTLRPDGGFEWTGKNRLISSRILSSAAGPGGKVTLDHFCGEELGGRYQGVMMFRFSGGDNAAFLYRFADGGLELSWASPKYIEDKIVKSDFTVENIKILFKAGNSSAPADSEDDAPGNTP